MKRTAMQTAGALATIYENKFGYSDLGEYSLNYAEFQEITRYAKLTDKYIDKVNAHLRQSDLSLIQLTDSFVVLLGSGCHYSNQIAQTIEKISG